MPSLLHRGRRGRLALFSVAAILMNVRAMPAQRGSSGPGELRSGVTNHVSAVLVRRQVVLPPGVPDNASLSLVLVCSYGSIPGATGPFDRIFWSGEAPAWVHTLAANDPVRQNVHGLATRCPPTLDAADDAIKRTSDSETIDGVWSVALTPTSLETRGMTNGATLRHLYLGEFDLMPFTREDYKFGAVFQSYLNACAHQCTATLPRNKVEMTERGCAGERYVVNGWGARIGTGACAGYQTFATGLYADSALYAAHSALDQVHAEDAAQRVGRAVTRGNPIANAADLLAITDAIEKDMTNLVHLNACASPAIKRFEENLKRFALGQPGLRLSEQAPRQAPKP